MAENPTISSGAPVASPQEISDLVYVSSPSPGTRNFDELDVESLTGQLVTLPHWSIEMRRRNSLPRLEGRGKRHHLDRDRNILCLSRNSDMLGRERRKIIGLAC